MKVNNILRCVCSPDSEDDGSIYYGMPQLKVTDNSEFWEVFCPKCGAVVSFVGAEEEKDCIKAWNRRAEKDVGHRST